MRLLNGRNYANSSQPKEYKNVAFLFYVYGARGPFCSTLIYIIYSWTLGSS